MHSRIFQISKNPIPTDELIEESQYYDHWFLNKMDYVSEVGDGEENDKTRRAELKEWLGDLRGFSFDEKELTLTLVDKEEYFKASYNVFVAQCRKLSAVTLEQFASRELELEVYRLQTSYEDEYSLYIDDNGEYHGVVTLDEWVHWSENGTKVYLGSIFDYHF